MWRARSAAMRGSWRMTESPEVRAELADLGVLSHPSAQSRRDEVCGFTDRPRTYPDLRCYGCRGTLRHGFGTRQVGMRGGRSLDARTQWAWLRSQRTARLGNGISSARATHYELNEGYRRTSRSVPVPQLSGGPGGRRFHRRPASSRRVVSIRVSRPPGPVPRHSPTPASAFDGKPLRPQGARRPGIGVVRQ
jgi:hypothetical protein